MVMCDWTEELQKSDSQDGAPAEPVKRVAWSEE
jgi:hypothetical protein